MFLSKYILLLPFITGAMFSSRMLREPDTHPQAKPPIRWTIQKNSTLRVEGQSNLNTFRCDIEGYYSPDTIICYDNTASSSPVKLNGSINIQLFSFDCHNKLITNDLRKTLKAVEHPTLVIRFLSLERVPQFSGNTDLVKGWVNIELAGVSKKFEILYSFVKPGSSVILLNGGRTFSFSDFSLRPPRRLAGIIQIKDEFSVNFRLALHPF